MVCIRFLAGLTALISFVGAVPCHAQTAPAAAAAPDPEKLAIAQDIIRIGFPPESRHAMLMRTSDALMTQVRDGMVDSIGAPLDPEMQRIFDRYMERVRTVANETFRDGVPAIFDAMARAYTRLFSRDELLQIRAFASTPAGAHFFQRSTEIISDPDVAAANRAHMERSFTALEPLMQDLRRDLAAELARRRRR